MITTEWVTINEWLEYRWIGPTWIAFLIVRSDTKKINPIIGRIFRFISKISGAKLQYRKPPTVIL